MRQNEESMRDFEGAKKGTLGKKGRIGRNESIIIKLYLVYLVWEEWWWWEKVLCCFVGGKSEGNQKIYSYEINILLFK